MKVNDQVGQEGRTGWIYFRLTVKIELAVFLSGLTKLNDSLVLGSQGQREGITHL